MGLCIILVLKSVEFMMIDIAVALISAVIIVSLLKNKWMPSAIAVLLFGVIVSVLKNGIELNALEFGFSLPKFYVPTLNDIATGLLYAGIAQIPLTLTNAVVATTALLKDYFPDKPVPYRFLTARFH